MTQVRTIAATITYQVPKANGVIKTLTFTAHADCPSIKSATGPGDTTPLVWQRVLANTYLELNEFARQRFSEIDMDTTAIEEAYEPEQRRQTERETVGDKGWCEFHQTTLYENVANNNERWFSHKHGDEFCKGQGTKSEKMARQAAA